MQGDEGKPVRATYEKEEMEGPRGRGRGLCAWVRVLRPSSRLHQK